MPTHTETTTTIYRVTYIAGDGTARRGQKITLRPDATRDDALRTARKYMGQTRAVRSGSVQIETLVATVTEVEDVA